MKYGFIILNYNTYSETEKCIKTIERTFGGSNIEVLVIDNASNDKSVEKLNANYDACEYVKILPMKDNLGFSRANNLGYTYMKKEKNVDFLFLCNSDIEFVQLDFEKNLLKIYENTRFHICGPDVFAPYMIKKYYHGHQSPTYPWEYTGWYTKYSILSQKIWEPTVRFRRIKKLYCLFIRIIQRILTATVYRSYRMKFRINTGIHGSCIILSKRYIENHDDLFVPETQFYYEELLLYLRVKREKLISVYSPDIQIIHQQGRSTEKRKNSEGDKWIRDTLIESGYVYLQELERIKASNRK